VRRWHWQGAAVGVHAGDERTVRAGAGQHRPLEEAFHERGNPVDCREQLVGLVAGLRDDQPSVMTVKPGSTWARRTVSEYRSGRILDDLEPTPAERPGLTLDGNRDERLVEGRASGPSRFWNTDDGLVDLDAPRKPVLPCRIIAVR
jgi:hypothetical protein